MIEVAIGIDIGSSYIKAVACSVDGTIRSISRIRSPICNNQNSSDIVNADLWWQCFKEAIKYLRKNSESSYLKAVSICISAISPTLIVFDSECESNAYGILYSNLPEQSLENYPKHYKRLLTEYRLDILEKISSKIRLKSPIISDLVGYLNFRLTGELTINSISLAEMGLDSRNMDHVLLTIDNGMKPYPVSPMQKIGEVFKDHTIEFGIGSKISVCGGCTDTLGSLVGAGVTNKSEKMIYLGTFNSLLYLEVKIDTLLNDQHCSSPPYTWLLSIPNMGLEIEYLSHRWFNITPRKGRIKSFDLAADQCQPGADGTLFQIPRWKNGISQAGKFSLLPNREGNLGDVNRKSRAVLESTGYAILAVCHQLPTTIKASGGGAQSIIWLRTLSNVLKTDVKARELSWEALGTAEIASKLIWQKINFVRSYHMANYKNSSTNNQYLINDNLNRIMEVYKKNGWL